MFYLLVFDQSFELEIFEGLRDFECDRRIEEVMCSLICCFTSHHVMTFVLFMTQWSGIFFDNCLAKIMICYFWILWHNELANTTDIKHEYDGNLMTIHFSK